MTQEWWHSDWLPTGLVGFGSALAASFAPDVVTNRPAKWALALVGVLMLMVAPVLRRWQRRRRSGSAVVISVALPSFTQGWEGRAREFARSRYLKVFPYRRTLPAAAGQWSAGMGDVNGHLKYLFDNPSDQEFDPGRASIFVSAPWCVAWAIAAPFQHYVNWGVYQETASHTGFFLASALRRDGKVEIGPDERTLISEEVNELGGGAAVRAIALKLGGHWLVADAERSARALGAERLLVVHERYATSGFIEETYDAFDLLCRQVYSSLKGFVDSERRSNAGTSLSFLVYASMPVSVAFTLGAYLGLGSFRLMHWNGEDQEYVVADVSPTR